MKKITLLLCFSLRALAADPDPQALTFFEKEVRPLLVKRCQDCHGTKKQKGDLRLDDISYMKTGGGSGPALVPGKPDESMIIKAIRYTDSDFEMPPKEKLPAAEIAILEKWVAMGAPWPTTGAVRKATDQFGFTEEDRNYWAFLPVVKPEVPVLPGNHWVRNEIDGFVAKKHAEMKLEPAVEAGRQELVRRLYYDLHGLPPTPEQVKAFVNNNDPQAYEKLVDELLASPRYGERWAQHWLDLVRYAESDGYNEDGYRAAVWPYRDWVIKSLNKDLPYDRFVREQIAGDEIEPENPDVLIATAYLRHPMYEWNQRDVKSQWEIILTDLTDTTGEVFLGLSFGCARCHNHKFDPILQKDYFRLKSFFTPVQWRDDLKLATPQERAAYEQKLAGWQEATASIRTEMDSIIEPVIRPKMEKAVAKFNDDLQAMIRKAPEQRDPAEKQLVNLCQRQIERERNSFSGEKSLSNVALKARYLKLEAELKAFESLKPEPLPEAFVATDVGATAPVTMLKSRKAETPVEPGFLTLLAPGDPQIAPIGNSTGRRTALANWITRPDNQLATRVIVNRVWQYHFGRGIVSTASDFGHLGEKPTHPELLDWLAQRFVSDGWSLKKLHRQILFSATYRQTAQRQVPSVAAEVDPSNRYLWRFNPRRLDAEQVRDAMLAASGELDLGAGGPSADSNSPRRSIYTKKKRNSQNELLRSLDAPAGFSSTADRQSTTTPTQALLLLNGEWPIARARKLAARISTPEQAWQFALGRLPNEREKAVALAFIDRHTSVAKPNLEPAVSSPLSPGQFKENTGQERLIYKGPTKEGEVFSVESVFRLESIDVNAAVRTLASRWSLGKDNIEAFGWSLGITGEKSRFQPRNLIVQLVGEDENANIGYEVVASDFRIELGHRYHAVVRVSCQDHTVSFRLQDLDVAGAPVLKVTVPHAIRTKLGAGTSQLVVGGLSRRAVPHQFDGQIEALRIVPGILNEGAVTADSSQWGASMLEWKSGKGPGQHLAWSAGEVKADDSRQQALFDLCQILLNTNEFFYLH